MIFRPFFRFNTKHNSSKLASCSQNSLYSLPILGRECASELVRNGSDDSSDIGSAMDVSALNPISTASNCEISIRSEMEVQALPYKLLKGVKICAGTTI